MSLFWFYWFLFWLGFSISWFVRCIVLWRRGANVPWWLWTIHGACIIINAWFVQVWLTDHHT